MKSKFKRPLQWLVLAASVLVMVACSMPDLRPSRPAPTYPSPPSTPAPPTDPTLPAPPSSVPPPSSRPGRPTPIPDRTISLNGQCTQTEEDGYREQATLLVDNNEVKQFGWQLWVGRKGSCRFDQADFRQTRNRPHIELLARDGSGCKLMVWQDGRKVTLAHAGCEKRCTAGIYDQAWPVMFDINNGRCARTG